MPLGCAGRPGPIPVEISVPVRQRARPRVLALVRRQNSTRGRAQTERKLHPRPLIGRRFGGCRLGRGRVAEAAPDDARCHDFRTLVQVEDVADRIGLLHHALHFRGRRWGQVVVLRLPRPVVAVLLFAEGQRALQVLLVAEVALVEARAEHGTVEVGLFGGLFQHFAYDFLVLVQLPLEFFVVLTQSFVLVDFFFNAVGQFLVFSN